jgi:dihydroorotase
VHFRDPGLTHKEDLYTGTLSAIAGGVTTVFEMPNTKPNTSTLERMQEKITIAEGKAKCDFAFFVGATKDNVYELDAISKMDGCCGIKIFMGSSTGDLLVAEDQYLESILRNTSAHISIHAEDENTLNERKHLAEQGQSPEWHPRWRNVTSALKATQRIVAIAEKLGRRIHVLHITSQEEVAFLKTKRHVATFEVLPQHLIFAAPECHQTLGTLTQMNPPIRSARHREALWKAIQDGTVDIMATDHAPHTWSEKLAGYPNTPSGLTGVQTLVPLMLDFVNQKKISLERFVELTSKNPAKIFGVRNKGSIEVGKDADFTIVDMNTKREITHAWIKSKTGWTPYDGRTVSAWPIMTIVRGQIAMRDDAIFANAFGKKVTFN